MVTKESKGLNRVSSLTLYSEFDRRGGADIALDVWVAEQQEALSGSGAIPKIFRVSKLRRVDDALDIHFITFSCDHRRWLFDHDQPKRILLGIWTEELLIPHADQIEMHDGRPRPSLPESTYTDGQECPSYEMSHFSPRDV